MKKSEGNSDNIIQALSKGLSVLECFKDIDEYGITEIGDIANLPDSSVQRIVHTLEMKGYLYQNPDNKKYRLTPKVLLICAKSGNLIRWREQARKQMIILNELCGENVNLAIRQDDMCSYIELVESKHLLRPHFTLGDFYPVYCTSLGRSLLSDLTDHEIDVLLPKVLEARTPFTLTDRRKVIEKIKEIKQTKYAIDDEEFYLGLCCIGSPIYGIGNKVIAALSVIAPKVRMDEKTIEKLIPAVITTAQNISEEYRTIFS
ncbi:HTH-type transcriptional regulator XynR [Sporomusa carbonis]|uniref:IclR family transcriptional regulator n=1 Tax=Sporomusa carbonis TaxID=3076075 RepID=UPI003A6619A4